MIVLGVTFDCRLSWSIHITNCINKAKKSLYALRLLKPLFTPSQMRVLLDSNFYSVLYYNSQIWLTPDLSSSCKHDLLAASSLALRSCLNFPHYDVSFINLHKQSKKCTPDQIMMFQLSLNAYKTINDNLTVPSTELVRLLDQIVCSRRQTLFEVYRTNLFKIGMNSNANKLFHISRQIVLEKFTWNYPHFKKHMKLQFLKFGNM